jgi:hypothetical protein
VSEIQATKRDKGHKGHEGGARRTCEGRPARRRLRPAVVRDIVGASKQSGRATLERPRPDTGGYDSHARTIYRGLQRAQVEHLPVDMQREAIGLLAQLLLNAAAQGRDR